MQSHESSLVVLATASVDTRALFGMVVGKSWSERIIVLIGSILYTQPRVNLMVTRQGWDRSHPDMSCHTNKTPNRRKPLHLGIAPIEVAEIEASKHETTLGKATSQQGGALHRSTVPSKAVLPLSVISFALAHNERLA